MVRSDRTVDKLEVWIFLGTKKKKRFCSVQDVIGTTAVCLLPGPVVFFLKKTKTNLTKSIPNCVLLLQLFIQGIHSWQFFCFGGFCHRFHVSDGHKSTGTEFQLMMWQ